VVILPDGFYVVLTTCHSLVFICYLCVALLAARLNWSAEQVYIIGMAYHRPGGSPTEMLLMEWGHTNATVEMLVFHLLQMNLNRAAELFRGIGKFMM